MNQGTQQKIQDFCSTFGTSVYVSGRDPLKVAEIKTLFKRWSFFVHEGDIGSDVIVDMYIVVDEVFEDVIELAQGWSTMIILNPDLLHNKYDVACSEIYCWDGLKFVDISQSPVGVRMSAEDNEYNRFVFFQGFPELEPYRDNIYVFYAGAANEYSFGFRRFHDCIQEIKEAFAAGYMKIVFYCGEETSQPAFLLKAQRLAEFLDRSGKFKKDTFFTVCAGADHHDIYFHLSRDYAYNVHVTPLSFNRFELHAHEYLKHADEELKYFLDRPYNTGKRDKCFVNFNRVPRAHRQFVLADLHRRELLDKGFVSFQADNPDMDKEVEWFKNTWIDMAQQYIEQDLVEHPIVEHQDYLEELLISLQEVYQTRLPLVLNRTAERDNPVTIEIDDLQYYDNSYFSIVNETLFFSNKTQYDSFSYDGVFFSEKIFKPFAAKHPFVLFGYHRSLKWLKELGYKTFHPYINEEYDEVVDDISRLQIAMDEVERLCNLSHSEWQQLQENIKPIIEHNYQFVNDFNKDVRYTKNTLHGFIGNDR